jgi:DDE superfamily endonuclease
MVCQPPASPGRAYCARASPIPSIAGLIASLIKAVLAYGCDQAAGASRLFPPHYTSTESVAQELHHTVGRDPRAYGLACTRWTLGRLRAACPWLWLRSDAGMHQLLKRCGITLQRAGSFIRSPDENYAAKLANVQAVRMLAREAPGQVVVVYLDEITIERHPSLAPAYAPTGERAQHPRARRSPGSNTLTRVLATLEHGTARVVSRRASKITIATLVQFFQDLCAAYPQAERIYVVLDNWPLHIHPDVLIALEKQETRYLGALPRSWSTTPSPKAVKQWGQLQLPIQLVPLPTYASWCNPIEKLWRKLRQELTHLHPWATDLQRLRAEIEEFLAQFATGSPELLRYVGLGVPD